MSRKVVTCGTRKNGVYHLDMDPQTNFCGARFAAVA